jgi:membrane protease YdiL (CAAX protease family)
MIPQPDAQNEGEQSDQRFGIIPPQNGAVGIPRGNAGWRAAFDGDDMSAFALNCKHRLKIRRLKAIGGGFFHWRIHGGRRSFPPVQSPPMSDPTFLILTGGFVAAVLVFAAAGFARLTAKRQTPPAIRPMPVETGPPWPYEPPGDATPPGLPPDLPPGRVAVGYYRPIDLLGAAMVFMLFSGLVIASLQVRETTPQVLDARTLLMNIGFQFIMAGMVTLLVIRRMGPVSWLGLRWPGWPWVFLLAPGAVVLMWLISGGLQVSGYLKWMESLGAETTQDTVKLLRETKDPKVLGLMVFAAVVAAPLCEEIVFRGYLYPVLKKFSGIGPAALSSSLVFAAAHGNLTALLPLLIFGGLLVLLYEKTGSIWAPIAAHFCFNAATVAVQLAIRHYDIPIGALP